MTINSLPHQKKRDMLHVISAYIRIYKRADRLRRKSHAIHRRFGGKKLKSCLVLISDEEGACIEWQDKLLPKIEQCGYLPRLIAHSKVQNGNYVDKLFIQIQDIRPLVWDTADELAVILQQRLTVKQSGN